MSHGHGRVGKCIIRIFTLSFSLTRNDCFYFKVKTLLLRIRAERRIDDLPLLVLCPVSDSDIGDYISVSIDLRSFASSLDAFKSAMHS